MLSSKAMLDGHGEESPYFQGWKEYEKIAYDDVQNPTGIVQMGLAENKVRNIYLFIIVQKMYEV